MDYVPLKEAAKKHNIDEQVLTQLISAGMIATKTEAGEILVIVDKNGNGNPQTKEEIINARFAHLQNQAITITEAAQSYDLKRKSLWQWIRRDYIKVLKPGYRMELNEADVAYCADVYHKKYKEYNGQLRGVNIFDENGDPYSVMHPALSRQRRQHS